MLSAAAVWPWQHLMVAHWHWQALAFAAAFFLLPFLPAMENENGPRRLFPESEIAELIRGFPLPLSSSYSHTTLTLVRDTTTSAASAPASYRRPQAPAEPATLSLAWVHPPLAGARGIAQRGRRLCRAAVHTGTSQGLSGQQFDGSFKFGQLER